MANKVKVLHINYNYVTHLDDHNGKCTRYNCLYLANKLIDKMKRILKEQKRKPDGNAST